MKDRSFLEGKFGVNLLISLTVALGNYDRENDIYVWVSDVVTSIYNHRTDSITLVYYGNVVVQSDKVNPILIPSGWMGYITQVRDNVLSLIAGKDKEVNVTCPYGKIGPMVE